MGLDFPFLSINMFSELIFYKATNGEGFIFCDFAI
jgi:hypothetical protein